MHGDPINRAVLALLAGGPLEAKEVVAALCAQGHAETDVRRELESMIRADCVGFTLDWKLFAYPHGGAST